uniref:Uncharacterized protein n=1 Tax=Mus spicilegus TaxID=10103 RepID=A0A8C6IIA9_MUSSI
MDFSNRTRKALQPCMALRSHASVYAHCPVVTCALLHTACCCCRAVCGDWGWQHLPGKAGCHHGTPEKKNTSHHWLISKESDSIF